MNAGLAPKEKRPLLFGRVMPAFFFGLPDLPDAYSQLTGDLRRLNSTDVLTDGSVPMQLWLSNALDLARPFPAAVKAFQEAHARIGASAVTPNRAVDTAVADMGGLEVAITNAMLPFSFLEEGAAAGQSVGKMMVPLFEQSQPKMASSGLQFHGTGTGWLIAKDLALTNHHVINARPGKLMADAADFVLQASKSTLQFDYDFLNAQGETLSVRECLLSATDLDFALLRLDADPARKRLAVQQKTLEVAPGSPVSVNLIQHPDGLPKQIGIRNNLVYQSAATQLSYFTDTLAGSSGSPVMNDSWEVVALHKGYQQVTNATFQGKLTTQVNYGIHIARILDRIQAEKPALWNEIKQAQGW